MRRALLLKAERYSMAWLGHRPLVHAFIDGHLARFHPWVFRILLAWSVDPEAELLDYSYFGLAIRGTAILLA